jgi:hypothetical protein
LSLPLSGLIVFLDLWPRTGSLPAAWGIFIHLVGCETRLELANFHHQHIKIPKADQLLTSITNITN